MNYAICERRTWLLAHRFKQTPKLLEIFSNIISEQVKHGFIEKVPTSYTGNVHYIPHHAVQKDSSTTHIRIVYDCSCHQSKYYPRLNDCLMIGPPYQNDICAILLCFRFHVSGLSTDIAKAFVHVRLGEGDRDYTTFLWLSDPSNPESEFQTYRFKSVLFGSVSSLFMLSTTLHCHLNEFQSPVATDMKNNLYVDNIISGTDGEAQAVKYSIT